MSFSKKPEETIDFVLIGGLAVGAWAQYFNLPIGGPIFSKDIDLRGTRLVAQTLAQGMRLRGGKGARIRGHEAEKTSNDRIHLELLGEIIPMFLAEAQRRNVDTLERRLALRAILDAHATPLGKADYEILRAALTDF